MSCSRHSFHFCQGPLLLFYCFPSFSDPPDQHFFCVIFLPKLSRPSSVTWFPFYTSSLSHPFSSLREREREGERERERERGEKDDDVWENRIMKRKTYASNGRGQRCRRCNVMCFSAFGVWSLLIAADLYVFVWSFSAGKVKSHKSTFKIGIRPWNGRATESVCVRVYILYAYNIYIN